MTLDSDAAQPLIFKPIELSQMRTVEDIRKLSGNTLYVYSFASLFAWQADEQYEICIDSDAFVVKNKAEGDSAYLFPCDSDEGKKRLVDSLIQHENPTFYTISDEDKKFLEREYGGKFEFEECRDEFSYLYDKDEQITLSGKAYKSLRHQINLGKATATEWEIEPLTADNCSRALDINRRWADLRKADDLADVRAAETAIENFDALKMWGLIFNADGDDTAYIAGTFVTPEIFDIAFCKVLDGRCDCYIKWELYNALPDEVKTVDSEEDLGIEGLRRHKLLRRPKELTRIWKGSII
ncbi:MAG: DUF2156 domain-containing protein [Eubacterium sp.]|nr:DUF2156 domain-containing protein [Eubacterium sp.]